MSAVAVVDSEAKLFEDVCYLLPERILSAPWIQSRGQLKLVRIAREVLKSSSSNFANPSFLLHQRRSLPQWRRRRSSWIPGFWLGE